MARLIEQLLRRFTAPAEARPLESYVELVDEALERLGIDGELERSEEGWSWGMQVGSAELTIALHRNEVLAEWTLEVRSAILRLPQANLLTFYRRCLELNRILVGCSIGVEQAGWPKPPPAQRPRGRGCRPISWATRSSLTDACSCQA